MQTVALNLSDMLIVIAATNKFHDVFSMFYAYIKDHFVTLSGLKKDLMQIFYAGYVKFLYFIKTGSARAACLYLFLALQVH